MFSMSAWLSSGADRVDRFRHLIIRYIGVQFRCLDIGMAERILGRPHAMPAASRKRSTQLLPLASLTAQLLRSALLEPDHITIAAQSAALSAPCDRV
jgi:hypothetical protein